MLFPLLKICECLWSDITTSNLGWQSPDSARETSQPTMVKTIGYVLEDTPQFLKLAMLQTQLEQNEVGVVATIPKGCIKRMKILKGLN